ncbi:MAG: hypothetical protein ACJARY_001812, partial [Candidatus Azotimanducaceae bacterium]
MTDSGQKSNAVVMLPSLTCRARPAKLSRTSRASGFVAAVVNFRFDEEKTFMKRVNAYNARPGVMLILNRHQSGENIGKLLSR